MNPIYPILTSLLLAGTRRTIIECGAHDGSDSMNLRRTFPDAMIACFEPDPRNIETIKQRGIHQIVGIVPAAVGDRDGNATFHLSSANLEKKCPEWIRNAQWSGSSSLKKPVGHLTEHPWCEFNTAIEVPVMRLDTFRQRAGIGPVDLLWADVQGAEDLLIAGAPETLAATSYFYTEYSEVETYERQIGLQEILARLPGRWELLHRFPHDALFRNTDKLGAAAPAQSAMQAA